MARYRTCLVLSLPEFDTTGVLARFARRPTRESYLAFLLLYRRAQRRLVYRAYTDAPSMDAAEALLDNMLGCERTEKNAGAATRRSLSQMSEEERMQFYMEKCKEVGMAVDAEEVAKQWTRN